MSLAAKFVDTFVNAFGITRPEPAQQNRIAVFLLAGLLLVLGALGLAAFVLFRVISG